MCDELIRHHLATCDGVRIAATRGSTYDWITLRALPDDPDCFAILYVSDDHRCCILCGTPHHTHQYHDECRPAHVARADLHRYTDGRDTDIEILPAVERRWSRRL